MKESIWVIVTLKIAIATKVMVATAVVNIAVIKRERKKEWEW